DSPLQTTHVAVGSLPVDGMPVNGWTQARASGARRRRFKFSTNSCFLPHRQRVSYRKTTRKSARLPVPQGGYPDHYHQAFAFSAIVYPASHRHSLRFAFRTGRRRSGSGKEATLPSPPPLRTVRVPFNTYRSSTDKPGSNPAGRELSFSTFTF